MAKRRYTYEFPRPSLTVDVAMFSLQRGQLHILLIQRKKAPYAGAWALPGGFVDENERLEDAARRELLEETRVKARKLQEFGVFGDPGRDPRGWTVSVGFLTLVKAGVIHPHGADDALQASWFPLSGLPDLAFDHESIIARAKEALFNRPVFWLRESGIIPVKCTTSRLKEQLGAIWGEPLSERQWVQIQSREYELLRSSGKRMGREQVEKS